jgi:ferredoxin
MEPLKAIHHRVKPAMSLEDLRSRLDAMAAKGLIERHGHGENILYGKSLFVVGIYERQVDKLTPELERDVLEYFDEGFSEAMRAGHTRQMRTVPVNKAIPIERGVARYDDIREVVRNSDGPFAAMNCVCRQGRELIGGKCRHDITSQNCLTFGPAAAAMVEYGAAHYVSREEMLELIDRADGDGLVLQPQNTRNPMFICCCCGCCCGVLTQAKKSDRPADFFNTNFVAMVDEATCGSCGECVERCQMDAVRLELGVATILIERCIGCGLCVTTCSTGAMRLEEKERTTAPPASTAALYAKIYEERYGPIGMLAAAGKKALGMKV